MTLDKEISCTYCSTIFQVEQIYIEHLMTDHGIQKNMDSHINIAKKKAGLPFKVKQEVIEEITIDDDDDEEETSEEDISSDIEITHENISLESVQSDSKIMTHNLSAKEISHNIFQPFNLLLENLGSESVPLYSDVDESDCDDDTEENIDLMFDNFRDKIRNLVLDQPSSSSNYFVTEPPAVEEQLDEQKENYKCPISNDTFASNSENENHAIPAVTKPKVLQTTYLCPVIDCTFFTNKEGMMNFVAAKHLNKVHEVTPEDIKKDGIYKWKKIKTQKD